MKLNKILNLFIGLMLLVFNACEPIVNREELQNSFNPDDIKLEVIQSTPGGNGLSIRMKTPGVTGYWDYNINKKFTDRVDVNYPIPGKSTFTFYVTTAYMPNNNPAEVEYISKSIDVQIDKLDQPLPDAYYALVGDNLEGKTWVFNGTGGDDGLWWYMSPPGDPSSWASVWWNAGGTCCPPADVSGKMVFDLNGGANYTYYSAPGATPSDGGSFAFNGDYTKLIINGGVNILGAVDGGGNSDATYNIIELTSDKMILYHPNADWGTGWTWVFKPE